MTRPMDVIHVEIAPGADLAAEPNTWTWVEITHLVDTPITAQVGRTSEGGPITPGAASATVKNWDGNLSPPNPLGDWYGQLDLDTPIRFTVDGVTEALYEGMISELPTLWQVYTDRIQHANSEVKAVGLLDWIAQGRRTIGSALARHVPDQPDVVAYWPMEDAGGSFASPLVGVSPIRVSGNVDFASADGPDGSDQLPSFRPGSTFSGAVPDPGSLDDWRMDWVFSIDTLVAAPRTVGRIVTRSGLEYTARVSETHFHLIVRSEGGTVLVDASDPLDSRLRGAVARGTLIAEDDGSDVDVTLTATVGGTVIQQIVDTVTNRSTSRPAQVWMGVLADDIPSRTVGQITVSRSIADPWAANGLTAEDGFTGERAAPRFERLCHEEGLRCEVIGDPDLTIPMGPQRPLHYAEHLEQIQSTEQGIIFERRFGLTLRTRVDLYNQQDALELDVSRQLAGDLRPMWDAQQRRNDVTVAQPGGTSATVDRSVHGARRFPATATANPDQDGRLELLASWLVHTGTVAEYRWPPLPIRVAPFNPQLIAPILSAVVGDRTTVAHPLPQLPGVGIDVFIEGMQHTLDAIGWDVHLICTPASPWRVLEMGHATQNWLHPVGHTLDAGIDDDDTTFDVAVTDAVWTTDSGDYPRDIVIGGEVMTVTAVGAVSSGTQPFTVTRGINGITKPHAAGSPVELHPTFVLGL